MTVSTEGERVTNAFHVSESDGRKVEGSVSEARAAVQGASGSLVTEQSARTGDDRR